MNSALSNNNNNNLINTSKEFEELYEYGNEVGKGRYATVKKCYCKKSKKCYAAKIIKNFRSKNNKLNLNIVENEITALTLARSHSSIVNLYEVFHHKGETILVLEYATEKDLHLYLDGEGAFEEEKACQIIYQVLKALNFLHSKNILHLDIKPENVLLMNPVSPSSKNNSISSSPTNSSCNEDNLDEEVKVKLCDFSFSQIMQPGKPILGMMGTVAYSAPEVLQYEPLTKATDMWSLGVLTHVLLTEYTPFGNGTEKNLQTETNILSVRETEFKCTEDYFDNISPEAQDFIENLLKYKPKSRLTVEQALNHNWFKKYGLLSNDKENLNLKENNHIEIRDQVLIEETFIDKNGFKTSLITSQNTNSKIIELKDDKNNNSLSSVDLKSSSTSSISSNETNESTCSKASEISIESYEITKQLNNVDINESIFENNDKNSVINSLIKNDSNFLIASSLLSNNNNKKDTNHDNKASINTIAASTSVVVAQISSQLATSKTAQY